MYVERWHLQTRAVSISRHAENPKFHVVRRRQHKTTNINDTTGTELSTRVQTAVEIHRLTFLFYKRMPAKEYFSLRQT